MEIESLIQQHKDAVYRQMVRTCLGNHDDAEDALAEAILAAIRASESLLDPGRFRPWLVRIAKRICLKVLERRDLFVVIQMSGLIADSYASLEPLPDEQVARREFRETVRGIVRTLPPIYRTIYISVDLNGMDMRDVCSRLDITFEAGKSRIRRARKLVRDALDESLSGGVAVFVADNRVPIAR